eukprot:3978762-Pyramimonas_sp.AAC.1
MLFAVFPPQDWFLDLLRPQVNLDDLKSFFFEVIKVNLWTYRFEVIKVNLGRSRSKNQSWGGNTANNIRWSLS